MKPLYAQSQLRAMEQAHAHDGLMEKAGAAAARLASSLLLTVSGARILVLAGPGNNGGDALVAARYLRQQGYQVDVVFTGTYASLPPDARAAYEAWLADGGEIASGLPQGREWQLIVDGLFGIGLTRELDALHRDLVQQVNAMGVPVLSLDIPTGICMHTGRVLGAAVCAAHTLTFLGLKPGLYTQDGPDHAGQVYLDNLGLNAAPPAAGFLVDVPPALPARRRLNSHKGSHGSVGVIGGAEHMVGAVLLAGRAALRAGAGRVYCGLLAGSAPALDQGQAELMLRDAASVPQFATVMVAGPGMGQSDTAVSLLHSLLELSQLLILDADALNLLAAHPELQAILHQRKPGTLAITPHPGEAATLLHITTAEVQADRVASALRMAREFGAIVVLKGCGSVVALPDGRWFINHSGNPGMASAGMGDTLCGIIAALAAQEMSLEEAVLLAVYLHGAAADSLVAKGVGPVGMTASEVASEARALLNQWRYR
ncbi:yjeF C-terminal region, hydroxyethylthiazole kinase-related/yjeF N-terminal region [Methylobacillus rhizosphaerae]|uniref:Bifunctional NAD(P)H-hydrate repair enzyme n=1 Tax=Methylobacillus rhizosphaerae TaxID=551994 RepID=A0A239ANF9_9PROT|nr:NAD(P)H-hydrate dehydratase [Methylobacillus rhizosphaerae]SNR97177.1 yjeF C-terminal region, hydroxyethylthiazole kinase-related/yjeF N-terminal region [Methylobacillus rhizosphaerae]